MNFLFVNLAWAGLVSKKTFKIHLALPPLDLILLHNMARRAGHSATVFDGFVDRAAALRPLVEAADWVVAAVTPYFMWQCPNCEWEWIKAALSQFPRQKLVLTGLPGTLFPERTLRETDAFALMRGEPEAPFLQFLEKQDWAACDGLSRLRDGVYQENPLPPPLELDRLTVEDYTAVDVRKYGYFLLGRRTGIFEASRGCLWKCTFCCQEMFGWRYRVKTPEVFAEEVSRAVAATGMHTAYFFDLEFTTDRKRTIRICEELQKRKLPASFRWTCQTRADMVDEELLAIMKAAGCVLVHYGVESGNPDILTASNKKITLDRIEKGVRSTKAAGLQSACFFMFGLPGEAPEHYENTLRFARRLNPTYASFHFAVPLPGTELYRRYLEKTGQPEGVWPAAYDETWPPKKRARCLARAYLLFYLFPLRLEFREFGHRLLNFHSKLLHFISMITPALGRFDPRR